MTADVSVGGGDVGGAGCSVDVDGEVRRLAMTTGPWPVRIWDRSSPKAWILANDETLTVLEVVVENDEQ